MNISEVFDLYDHLPDALKNSGGWLATILFCYTAVKEVRKWIGGKSISPSEVRDVSQDAKLTDPALISYLEERPNEEGFFKISGVRCKEIRRNLLLQLYKMDRDFIHWGTIRSANPFIFVDEGETPRLLVRVSFGQRAWVWLSLSVAFLCVLAAAILLTGILFEGVPLKQKAVMGLMIPVLLGMMFLFVSEAPSLASANRVQEALDRVEARKAASRAGQ